MPYIDDSRRSKPLPELPPSEDDNDYLSPPAQFQPRAGLDVNVLKNMPRSTRSADPAQNHTPGTLTPMTNKTGDKIDDILKEKLSTLRFEQPAQTTNRAIGPLGSTTNIHPSSLPTMTGEKPSLIHRITSKLHIAIPTTTSSPQHMTSATYPLGEGKHPSRPARSPRTTHQCSPSLPNSFVSRENREAALRERGLRPKDLSELEREADERLVPVPVPASGQGESGPSAASKIKEEWLSMNRSSFPPTSMRTSFLSSP